MHKKVKQKISLSIFLKIWSFYSKVRNFSCFDILQSIILFEAMNILKNTSNMKKKSSQSLLKMIEISECKNFKLSNNLQDALRIFFSTIVKNTGSRNTLITDQDIIDTR